MAHLRSRESSPAFSFSLFHYLKLHNGRFLKGPGVGRSEEEEERRRRRIRRRDEVKKEGREGRKKKGGKEKRFEFRAKKGSRVRHLNNRKERKKKKKDAKRIDSLVSFAPTFRRHLPPPFICMLESLDKLTSNWFCQRITGAQRSLLKFDLMAAR